MKITSELTGKEYQTVEECLKAEKEYNDRKEKLKQEEDRKQANLSKRKKALANEIDKADKALTEANKLYEVARGRAAEILEKSNKEVKEIMDTAEQEVKKAERDRLNAIIAFNKEFGTYTTSITGERAAEQFEKSLQRFDNLFGDIFKLLF